MAAFVLVFVDSPEDVLAKSQRGEPPPPRPGNFTLFHCHRLRQVAWLIDVAPAPHGNVVGQ